MSETIPITVGTLPQGFCPSTEQERADGAGAIYSVTIGDYYGRFVTSSSTPAPEDQDKLWLKLDGSGNPIGFFLYIGGDWVQVDPPNVWVGDGGGSTNAYTLDVANYPSATGPRTNDVFIFSIPTSLQNTGASTLNLNGTGAKSLKSATADLWSGALESNKWYTAVFDGTAYEVISIRQLIASDIPAGDDGDFFRTRDVLGVLTSKFESYFEGAETSIPGVANAASFAHGLGSVPIIVNVRLRCKTADIGYSVGDEVDLSCVYFAASSQILPVFTINVSSISIELLRTAIATAVQMVHNGTGAENTSIAEGSWKLVCYAIK